MPYQTKEEIEASLALIGNKIDQIHKLESDIEKRIEARSKLAIDVNQVPLTSENVKAKIRQMAKEFAEQYKGVRPIFVSLMDGALSFAYEFQQALCELNYDFQYETRRISSYTGTTSGDISYQKYNSKVGETRRIVIVLDDICDTGKTYLRMHDELKSEGADSVELVALIDKKQDRKKNADPVLSGFTVDPKTFVIGFGMDYEELGRNYTSVHNVNPECLPSEEEKALLDQKPILSKQYRELSDKLKLLENQASKTSHQYSTARIFQPDSPGAANARRPGVKHEREKEPPQLAN